MPLTLITDRKPLLATRHDQIKVFLNNTYRQQSTISYCLRIFIFIQRFGFFRTMSDYLQLQNIPLLKRRASTLKTSQVSDENLNSFLSTFLKRVSVEASCYDWKCQILNFVQISWTQIWKHLIIPNKQSFHGWLSNSEQYFQFQRCRISFVMRTTFACKFA